MTKDKVSISELERQIFEKEEIRVTVRDGSGALVDPYPYERKEADSTSLSKWLERRVQPLVGNREIVVSNGQGIQPHGRTQVEKVRASYKTD
jgi:hypothetical protein